jgi:hypothetical protein
MLSAKPQSFRVNVLRDGVGEQSHDLTRTYERLALNELTTLTLLRK